MRFRKRSTTLCKIFRRPESADTERALRGFATITIEQRACRVAGSELAAEGLVSAAHALGIFRLELIPRDAQQRGIRLRAVELAHVTIQLHVPGTLADLPC